VGCFEAPSSVPSLQDLPPDCPTTLRVSKLASVGRSSSLDDRRVLADATLAREHARNSLQTGVTLMHERHGSSMLYRLFQFVREDWYR
jgi:hypothetical protein